MENIYDIDDRFEIHKIEFKSEEERQNKIKEILEEAKANADEFLKRSGRDGTNI